MQRIPRRTALAGLGVFSGLWLASGSDAIASESETSKRQEEPVKDPFGYCFNSSTIRGQKVGVVQQVEIAAKAGYQAIEPWLDELNEYVRQGGSLRDLGRRIHDLGMSVESGIGFAEWIVDDEATRAKGLEQARRDMETLAQIGAKRIAAPPAGATQPPKLDLAAAAARYAELLKLGASIGVVPQLELWGFSHNLSRLGETLYVAAESGHPDACILADVYHLHKGGSGFSGLHLLNGGAAHVLHMNDYPAEPLREKIDDSYRVFPGDGAAPLKTILAELYRIGFRGMLSLELFNREYWKQDPLEVATTGLQKMKDVVAMSLEV